LLQLVREIATVKATIRTVFRIDFFMINFRLLSCKNTIILSF
jgi:hypothetical protein